MRAETMAAVLAANGLPASAIRELRDDHWIVAMLRELGRLGDEPTVIEFRATMVNAAAIALRALLAEERRSPSLRWGEASEEHIAAELVKWIAGRADLQRLYGDDAVATLARWVAGIAIRIGGEGAPREAWLDVGAIAMRAVEWADGQRDRGDERSRS